MQARFHNKFIKQLQRAPQEIRKATKSRIELFTDNPDHPLLRNHALIGKYQGYRSINVTGDWRAVYQEIDSIMDDVYALFVFLGTHSQLYK